MSMSDLSKKAEVTDSRMADENHRVLTVEKGGASYRKVPCPGCPWRIENAGEFPPEAFRLSANTAYDGAINMFGCHESGSDKPATCAGFLLQNSANNIGARIAAGRTNGFEGLNEGGANLYNSYKEMAIDNGVDPDDPVLRKCRSDGE